MFKRSVYYFFIVLSVLFLGVSAYFNIHIQTKSSYAQINTIYPYDSCHRVHLTFGENPSCPSGSASIGNYSWSVTVSSADGNAHSVTYTNANSFCPSSFSKGCTQNSTESTNTRNVPFSFTMSRSPTFGSNCGTYQDDLWITSVDGNNSCKWGSRGNPGGAGFCTTNRACQYSNFGPCAGLPPSQSMCTNAPCGTSPANNFKYTIYSNCPSCACKNNCCGFPPVATPTPTPTNPPPGPTDKCPCFIRGAPFLDNQKTDGIQDNGETDYNGNYTFSIDSVGSGNIHQTMTQNPAGYRFNALPAGQYKVTFNGPGNSFKMTEPLNTPPSFTVWVGPNCSVGGSKNARCDANQNIIELDFGFISNPQYSISGNVYVDNDNSQTFTNPPDTLYNAGTSTITFTNGPISVSPINTSNGVYNTGTILPAGTYTVSYTSLPSGYFMSYPLNGTVPPQYNVTVGPGCAASIAGLNDATCTSNSISNLNFGILQTKPWVQSFCGDLRVDSGINDPIPNSPTCGSVSGAYAIQTNSTCTSPGVAYSGNQKADFNKGTASAKNWVAGDSFNPEVYKPEIPGVIRTSYQYIETTAKQGGITPKDLSKSCALNNCDISTLSHGVYQANGDLTTVSSNQDLAGGVNIIILVKGNAYINGDIDVPVGSTLLVSVSGDIHVNKNLGEGVVTSTSGTIGGIYSADGSFIVDGNGISTCTDKRLNIEGSVIVNAGEKGGTFDYSKRDLCAQNSNCPVVGFIQRPDLIFNMPAFVKHTASIFQEVAP